MTAVIFALSFSHCYQEIMASGGAGGAVESCPLLRRESGAGGGFAAKFSHLLGISGFFWLLPSSFGRFCGVFRFK